MCSIVGIVIAFALLVRGIAPPALRTLPYVVTAPLRACFALSDLRALLTADPLREPRSTSLAHCDRYVDLIVTRAAPPNAHQRVIVL
jgi:hypothetical protein